MGTTMLIAMFKTGPFAYNGILGFWSHVIAFFIWMVIMTLYTHKAIMRHAVQQQVSPNTRQYPAETAEPNQALS